MSPSSSRSGTATVESAKITKKMECISRKLKKTIKEEKNVKIRIATINVRTCQDDIKLAMVVKAASHLGIDILTIQESRRIGSDCKMLRDKAIYGWHLAWSGHRRKAVHGVATLLAPHVSVEGFKEHLAARILSTTVVVRGMRLSILNVYAPTDKSPSSTKSAFYTALTKAKKELDLNPKFKVLTLEDLNATISSKSKDSGAWERVLGNNNSDRVETTDNGEKLLTWCSKNKVKLVNTLFRTKRIHRGTWHNPHTRKWKRVDYVCASKWLLKFIRSCRVYIGPSNMFETDHRLLVTDIVFPATKYELRKHTVIRRDPRRKTNFAALKTNADLQEQLTVEIENELNAEAISQCS